MSKTIRLTDKEQEALKKLDFELNKKALNLKVNNEQLKSVKLNLTLNLLQKMQYLT